MLILKRVFQKNKSGYAVLKIETSDDLWVLYNLVTEGDCVKGLTLRKVQKEKLSGVSCNKVHRMLVTISVKSTDYDSLSDTIRFSGTNTTENEYIKLGQYHTIQFSKNCTITLYKTYWDFISLKKLNDAADTMKSADTAILLIDNGVGNFFVLTPSLTKDIFSVSMNIPKARGIRSGHKEAMSKFFKVILINLLLYLDKIPLLDCLIVAGPGFCKDNFYKFMMEKAKQQNLLSILNKMHIFLIINSSTAFKTAINEVLLCPNVRQKMCNVKTVEQTVLLDKIQKLISKNSNLVCYGISYVEFAIESGAVETLLLCDSLWRTSDNKLRRHLSNFVDVGIRNKMKVVYFSDSHVSGRELSGLTGIAALLRYPVYFENHLEKCNEQPYHEVHVDQNLTIVDDFEDASFYNNQ